MNDYSNLSNLSNLSDLSVEGLLSLHEAIVVSAYAFFSRDINAYSATLARHQEEVEAEIKRRCEHGND